MCCKLKVTIHPKFFGTVPNFEGLSRKKYEVIRDAELSWIPNPVPNLFRFNVKMRCSSSSWSKCSWSFWRFCLSEMCSVELKMHKIHFRPGLRPGSLWGNLGRSPIDPIVGWWGDKEGDTPPCTLPPWRLDLGIFAASKCPEFLSDLWSPYANFSGGLYSECCLLRIVIKSNSPMTFCAVNIISSLWYIPAVKVRLFIK